MDQKFDAQLLRDLNEEYKPKPVLSKDDAIKYDPTSLLKRGQETAGLIHKYFSVQGFSIDGQRILEIGCGHAAMLQQMVVLYECEAHGVDIKPRAEWDQATNCKIYHRDLSQEPYDDLGQFDFIYSWSAWEHVEHPFSMLKATKALLKPEGAFLLLTNLHRGVQASHLYRELYFPWPHLLFSDDVVKEYFVSIGKPPVGHTWVNRLSIGDYMNYFRQLDFEVLTVAYSGRPFDEAFYKRFEQILGRYPKFDLSKDFMRVVLAHKPT